MKLNSIRQYGKFFFSIFLMGMIMFALPGASEAAAGDTTRVSVKSDGTQGDSNAVGPSISSDGRYVAFTSPATNLVAGDTNLSSDVFVHDRNTGVTTRISVSSLGVQGNDISQFPSISADGNFVAFTSDATNLVAGDNNGNPDIFVHNRNTGVTTRVSVATDGTQGNNLTENRSSISADGRYVAFDSDSSNLVTGDTNGASDVFIRDTVDNTTTRVSVKSDGTQGGWHSVGPSISADGSYVAFSSDATNLVADDTNGVYDVFVRDWKNGTGPTTERVSVLSDETQASGGSTSPVISSDGRYVAFESTASNLYPSDNNGVTDVFIRDRQNGATARLSVSSGNVQGNSHSSSPSISADGRYVAFYSSATNLVAGDSNNNRDVFVTDWWTGTTTRISLASNGAQGDERSDWPSISADGKYVAFQSRATNLVTGDTNGTTDTFVHERGGTPAEIFASGSVPPSNGGNLTTGPFELVVKFNKAMVADSSVKSATSQQNYMLVGPGPNGVFNTTTASAAICASNHLPSGDDVKIDITAISYDAAAFTATLDMAPQFTPLPNGSYRLYLCGAASIYDLGGNPLNSGVNSAVNFTVGAAAPVVVPAAAPAAVALPATGFAPHRVTVLPSQPAEKAYTNLSDLWLEIPKLGVKMDIVGVPQSGGKWDVAWLGADAGWLEGSAFPSWEGNSVLTGHVWNADNSAGPFRYINTLWWGDQVIVHAWGTEYVYEVRSVRQVTPGSVSAMMKHEEQPWVTLVTCRGYNPLTDDYKYRVLVRAALVKIK